MGYHHSKTVVLSFFSDAKGQDFVNDFLLTFRYIITPLQLYEFITNVYTSGTCVIETGGTQTYQQVQVQFRSLDILYEWIEVRNVIIAVFVRILFKKFA